MQSRPTVGRAWTAPPGMIHNAAVLYLAAGVMAYLPIWLLAPYRPEAVPFLAAMAPPFVLLAACHRAARGGGLRIEWILALGLAVRIGFLFQAPSLSEDVYRYLWDGALVAEGESPYTDAPRDLAGARSKRPELFSRMAHRDRLSVYPPLAQYAFALSWGLWRDSTVGWRILLLLAEACLIAVFLAGFRTPPARLALWVLHPLPIIEFYSSGHLDVLPLAALAAAFWMLSRPGTRLAGSALIGAAALLKIFPAFFAPLALRLDGWKRSGATVAAFLAAVAVVSLPLPLWTGSPLESARSLVSAVLGFHEQWRFNSLPFLLLQSHRRLAGMVATTLFAVALGALTAGPPRRSGGSDFQDFASRGYFLLAAFYGLAHTVHPWYTTWILLFYPLLGLRYWAGFWLASVCSLSYLAYAEDPPRESLWVLLLQYVPYYFLLLRDLGAYHHRENERQALFRDRQTGR